MKRRSRTALIVVASLLAAASCSDGGSSYSCVPITPEHQGDFVSKGSSSDASLPIIEAVHISSRRWLIASREGGVWVLNGGSDTNPASGMSLIAPYNRRAVEQSATGSAYANDRPTDVPGAAVSTLLACVDQPG